MLSEGNNGSESSLKVFYVIKFQTQEIDLWTPKKCLYSNSYLVYYRYHNMEKKVETKKDTEFKKS